MSYKILDEGDLGDSCAFVRIEDKNGKELCAISYVCELERDQQRALRQAEKIVAALDFYDKHHDR